MNTADLLQRRAGIGLCSMCCASIEAKPPTWHSTRGQVGRTSGVGIGDSEYDPATGTISGRLHLQFGPLRGPHPDCRLEKFGACRAECSRQGDQSNHAESSPFAVYWGSIGGLSAVDRDVRCEIHSPPGTSRFLLLAHDATQHRV